MRKDLADLLDRMTRDERNVSSDQSVSWAAYREAEMLDDLSILDDLLQMLARKTPELRRRASYFIIGKLGRNRQHVACSEALLRLLASETNKYNIAAILEELADLQKPATLDLSPIYSFLNDTRWLVRHAAIQSLAYSEDPEFEDHLLQHLASTGDPADQAYCHSVLNRSGTAKSIPALTANLSSRKRDVKLSAELALRAIRSRQAT